jgi:hypothetical protein
MAAIAQAIRDRQGLVIQNRDKAGWVAFWRNIQQVICALGCDHNKGCRGNEATANVINMVYGLVEDARAWLSARDFTHSLTGHDYLIK